jgi:hypothetical protein
MVRGFEAQLDPNTAYQIFLDLPDDASEPVRDRHYVGMLVVFAMGSQAPHMQHDGDDLMFDVTDVVKELHTTSELLSATSVTFSPVGAPASASSPTVREIELQRR